MSDNPTPPENMPAAESATPPPVPDAPLTEPEFERPDSPPKPASTAAPATHQESPAEQAQRHMPLSRVRASKPHAPAGSHHAASQQGACARCGGTDFGQGTLVGYDGLTKFRPAHFKPAGLSFFRLHNALRPRRKLAEVEAQVCRGCGLVIFQVDVEKLAKVEGRDGQS